MLTLFPQCNISLEFPEILSQDPMYMLSLTEFVWDFQNNALWDTQKHAILSSYVTIYGTMLE